MCGRANSQVNASQLVHQVCSATNIPSLPQESHQQPIERTDVITPGMLMNVAFVENGHVQVSPMIWGFKMGQLMLFNVQSETMEEKPMYKKGKRGVVLLDGFYESMKDEKSKKIKQRFFVSEMKNNKMFIPVIYRSNQTFSMLTTDVKQENLKKIHQRQPVILNERMLSSWLNHQISPTESNDLSVEFNIVEI